MVTTSELYKLPGANGTIMQYGDDSYFLDSAGTLFRVPTEMYQVLKKSSLLIPHGGVFEKSSEEVSSLFFSNWKTSSIHREMYQADIRAEVVLCGEKLFYIKKSFLEDFPDGSYIFASEDGITLKLCIVGSAIKSYSMPEGDFSVTPSKLAYVHSFNGVTYTPLWQVMK